MTLVYFVLRTPGLQGSTADAEDGQGTFTGTLADFMHSFWIRLKKHTQTHISQSSMCDEVSKCPRFIQFFILPPFSLRFLHSSEFGTALAAHGQELIAICRVMALAEAKDLQVVKWLAETIVVFAFVLFKMWGGSVLPTENYYHLF